MTIQHSALTGSDLHEPKGAAAAAVGRVYVANGAASGSWRTLPHGGFYYDAIGTGTSYTPVAYTKIGPATVANATPREVTVSTTGRLTYTGSTTIDAILKASVCFKHSVGGVDCYFQVFKDGVALAGAQIVQNPGTAFASIDISAYTTAATNSYFEVFLRAATGNIIVHAITLSLEGKI